MNKSKERQSNIELLRILTVLGVIILHYINPNIGGGFLYVEHNSINYYSLMSLESVFICAVDLFFIISGYFLTKSYKCNIRKPVELIVQVIIFKVIYNTAKSIATYGSVSVKLVLVSILPTNYFVIFYCVLYIIHPYINVLLDRLSYKDYKRFLLILAVLFLIWPTFVNVLSAFKGDTLAGIDTVGMYGNHNGYNIVNFLLMYILGAFVRRYNINEKCSKGLSIIALIVSSLALLIWSMIDSGIFSSLGKTAWTYNNPVVAIEAFVVFLFFLNINMGVNRIVNMLARCVFSVFLLHGYFLNHVNIQGNVNKNVFIMFGHIILTSVGIYLISMVIHYIYNTLSKLIFDKIFKGNLQIVKLENTDDT